MAFLVLIPLALALITLVGATKVTFTKLGDRVYAETDPQHYAMYGDYRNSQGIVIIAMNGKDHHKFYSKCDYKWTPLDELDKEVLEDIGKRRERYLEEKGESPSISNTKTDSYTWSDEFSKDDRKFSVVKLDDNTKVYSSRYFPKELARVIISGDVVISIRYDGHVGMKTKKCLAANERTVYKAIKSIRSNIALMKDTPLRVHLATHKINESDLYDEQDYIKIYTDEDYRQMQQNLITQPPPGVMFIDFRDKIY